MKYVAAVEGRQFEIDIDQAGEATVDGQAHDVDLHLVDDVNLYSLLLDKASHELIVERREGLYYVFIEGYRYTVEVQDARLSQLQAMGAVQHEVHGVVPIVAPMPGLVVKVLVAPGDEVQHDQGLLILEAMKMENEIRSPRQGVVRSVAVEPGRAVNLGDSMLVIGDPD